MPDINSWDELQSLRAENKRLQTMLRAMREENERLTALLFRIHGLNDNPACFNPNVDAVLKDWLQRK